MKESNKQRAKRVQPETFQVKEPAYPPQSELRLAHLAGYWLIAIVILVAVL